MTVKFGFADKYDYQLLELNQSQIALTKNPDGPDFASFGTSISYEAFENGSLNEIILGLFGQEIFDFISIICENIKSETKNLEPIKPQYFWEYQQNDSTFSVNCDGINLFLTTIDKNQKEEKMSFSLEQTLLPFNLEKLQDLFSKELYNEIVQKIKNLLLKRIFEA